MANFKILTPEREALIAQALAPQFLGRQQVNLIAFADEIADLAYDQVVEQLAPIQDFAADLQSPGGAGMIGVTDGGGYFGGVGNVEDALQAAGAQIAAITGIDLSDYAPLDSPVFVGNPVAPTPALGDNDTSIATTAWVKAQGYSSGAGSGSVTSVAATGSTGLTVGGSPITTSGTLTFTLSTNLQNWSGLATSAKQDASANLTSWSGIAPAAKQDSSANLTSWSGIDPATKANLASPALTGTPTAPTAATATNTTQIATTAFVKAQGYALDSATVHTTGNETITGIKTFNTGISSGAATAASLDDVSRHYTAHTNGYGIGVTSGAINLVAGASGGINFVVNGNTTASAAINGSGTFTYAGSEVGWRNLNRVTGGVSSGQMYATTGGFTVNAASAAGLTLYVYNNSASPITLTQGTATLRLSGTATTGNRTVAQRGFATLWYNTTTECIVSGDVT